MRYLRTFLKRWYLYVIPMLIFPVIATAYGYSVLRNYQCSALLWVDKPVFLSTQDFGWDPYESAAQNEASAMTELLLSEGFVDGVAAQTNLANQLDLKSRYGKDTAFAHIAKEVAVYATGVGQHTITLTVTDKNPQLSLQIAQALITAYTTQYQSNRLQLDNQAIGYYQQLVATTSGLVTQDTQKIHDYLNAHPGLVPATSTDPTLAQLDSQLQQDQQTLDSQNTQIAELRQDMLATNVASSNLFEVSNPPQLPLSPTISKKSLFLMYSGGGLGIALALVGLIVAGLTQLDRKVYSKRDLELIADAMEVEFPPIEVLPILAGTGRSGHKATRVKGYEVDGLLLPALAALPKPRGASLDQAMRTMTGARAAIAPDTLGGEE